MKATAQGENSLRLGGTARSPGDVMELHRMGLGFAEIPIPDPEQFIALTGEYRTLRHELGLDYLCHGPREGDPNSLETLETVYLPKLLKILSLMPALEMRLLTIHLWMDPRFVSPDVIAHKVGLLKRVLKTADDADITVCLENLSENATHLYAVFEALPSLNLTLDLGHAQLLTAQNTSFGFLQRVPERIRHIHVHDNRGGNTPAEDLHLPVGKGVVDFEGIFRDLRLIGYHRTMTLELQPDEVRTNLPEVRRLLRHAGFKTR
ncbi:MAG: sugar phosphate isomerase/epimerase [Deltaproteobacteria bacterium]|nr:sugar phosphate isomerase/epimerase [Deltaproteobacteria bacterium]